MMDNNYTLSCSLFDACQRAAPACCTPRPPRSTAARTRSARSPEFERPLNVYGYSQAAVRPADAPRAGPALQAPPSARWSGFRYFNVYGPREQHKGRMASVAFHQFNQFREQGKVRLFGEYGGYGPGEQKRDFVFIDDVVAVNLWFLDHPEKSGIFNLGTGRAQPFNDVALAVVNALQPGSGAGRGHGAGRRG